MKMPTSVSCQQCHGDRNQLQKTLQLAKVDGDAPGSAGEVRDLGDGVRRFLPPRLTPHQPIPFRTFEQGHPRFGYEAPHLRDPGAIRYNHWRHDQPDVPKLNGRALDCADCHKPGGDGAFYQPISFEQHCVKCHSLHFDPDVPTLAIPHGDPEKVRAYLRSLASLYSDYALNHRNITDRAQLKLFVNTQLQKLQDRGITTVKELENRVFFTGDPPEVPGRVLTRSNKAQFFAGCAKCHEVTPAEISGAPRITPTNLADRWLTRGPFTHLPHAHMSCMDCHRAATTSKKTSDILLPAQNSCTECHRALDGDEVEPLKAVSTPEAARTELAAKQRREGGIASDCQSCHKFHAPTDADVVLELVSQKR
jgi:nitrate reductase cytochrome c-type subunit